MGLIRIRHQESEKKVRRIRNRIRAIRIRAMGIACPMGMCPPVTGTFLPVGIPISPITGMVPPVGIRPRITVDTVPRVGILPRITVGMVLPVGMLPRITADMAPPVDIHPKIMADIPLARLRFSPAKKVPKV